MAQANRIINTRKCIASVLVYYDEPTAKLHVIGANKDDSLMRLYDLDIEDEIIKDIRLKKGSQTRVSRIYP